MKHNRILIALLILVAAAVPAGASGIVRSIVKAPVVPGGIIAGGQTEFVINFGNLQHRCAASGLAPASHRAVVLFSNRPARDGAAIARVVSWPA